LQRISSTTADGKTFDATTATDIDRVFVEIFNQL
jgi:hypothetical protein